MRQFLFLIVFLPILSQSVWAQTSKSTKSKLVALRSAVIRQYPIIIAEDQGLSSQNKLELSRYFGFSNEIINSPEKTNKFFSLIDGLNISSFGKVEILGSYLIDPAKSLFFASGNSHDYSPAIANDMHEEDYGRYFLSPRFGNEGQLWLISPLALQYPEEFANQANFVVNNRSNAKSLVLDAGASLAFKIVEQFHSRDLGSPVLSTLELADFKQIYLSFQSFGGVDSSFEKGMLNTDFGRKLWSSLLESIELRDLCPNDPQKSEPEICGCGVAEADGDGDGTPNCIDKCPFDSTAVFADSCGCGVIDSGDQDQDGLLDCIDACPVDPLHDSLPCGPTPSPTATPSFTPLVTRTPTANFTPTKTATPTITASPSATAMKTPSSLPTVTKTPTASATPTKSGVNIVVICFNGRTMNIPNYLLNSYLSQGATAGACR